VAKFNNVEPAIVLAVIRLNVAALSGGEDAGKDKGPMS